MRRATAAPDALAYVERVEAAQTAQHVTAYGEPDEGANVAMTTKAELLEELTISLPGCRLGRQESETDDRETLEHWRAQYEAAQAEISRLRTDNSLAWARVEVLRGQVARLQGALLGAGPGGANSSILTHASPTGEAHWA